MIRYKEKKSGFSLIGVIVSLFIVAIGLTGIVSLSSMSLKSSTTSKMRLIASGLAQEGIEVIRDARRSNSNWDDWYSLISNGDYRVQCKDNPPILTPVYNDNDARLKIDTNDYYQHDSGDNSPFYRKINFNKVSANELKLTVEIKWKIRNQWSYLTVEDHLINS